MIEHPFVSVAGGVQPDVLGDLIDSCWEDGFVARVLLAYPDPLPTGVWSEVGIEGTDEYRDACLALWRLRPSAEPMVMNPEATAEWVRWYDAHNAENPSDALRPVWSKAEAHCLRLALILFLARRACGEMAATQVDEASVRGTVELIEKFNSHARRAYAQSADRADTGRIGNALRWIRRHGGRVTAHMAGTYRICKGSEAAKELFQLSDPTPPNAQRDSVTQ